MAPERAALPWWDWRKLTLGLLGLAAVALVSLLAMHEASPPERCVEGMVALGPRCCGQGQTLEAGRCRGEPRRCGEGLAPTAAGCVASPRAVPIAGGLLRVAPSDWEAAELGLKHYEALLEGFAIDSHEVSEAAYAECVQAGACTTLPTTGEPGLGRAWATLDQAQAYCRFRGGALPTPDQWRLAAMGTEGRRYPWGDTGAVCRRATFGLDQGPCAEGASGPELGGAHPAGASPDGVHDLAGNLAEWTLSPAGEASVRGGSWRDPTATALRTWHERPAPTAAGSAEVGFRCVYPTAEAPAP
jgi:formylglycine-generating enzyme required for sulfatase activity